MYTQGTHLEAKQLQILCLLSKAMPNRISVKRPRARRF